MVFCTYTTFQLDQLCFVVPELDSMAGARIGIPPGLVATLGPLLDWTRSVIRTLQTRVARTECGDKVTAGLKSRLQVPFPDFGARAAGGVGGVEGTLAGKEGTLEEGQVCWQRNSLGQRGLGALLRHGAALWGRDPGRPRHLGTAPAGRWRLK